MENFLHTVQNTFHTIVQSISAYSKPFIDSLPQEVNFLGLILGFLLALRTNSANYIHVKNFFYDLCHASQRLAIITTVFMAGYIYYFSQDQTVFYYIGAAFLGFLICQLLIFLLEIMGALGQILGILLSSFSGPVAIILCWFFYTGEFHSYLRKIF